MSSSKKNVVELAAAVEDDFAEYFERYKPESSAKRARVVVGVDETFVEKDMRFDAAEVAGAVEAYRAKLERHPTKGAAFRRNVDLNLAPVDLHLPRCRVDERRGTNVVCVVCDGKIVAGEDRCKNAVVNRGLRHEEKCRNHAYHPVCLYVARASLVPGGTFSCFGVVCNSEKGGCRR